MKNMETHLLHNGHDILSLFVNGTGKTAVDTLQILGDYYSRYETAVCTAVPCCRNTARYTFEKDTIEYMQPMLKPTYQVRIYTI